MTSFFKGIIFLCIGFLSFKTFANTQPTATPPEIAKYFQELRTQKQKIDPSTTESFVLENQLRVTLVSDKRVTKSGAAFSVNAGLTSDPLPYRGLAHYLEHMLFLGSKKYPTPGEYKKFISANAGYSNAYTSNVETNYHFAVNTAALTEALDRMTQFFTHPLFDESSMSREIEAIQSEYDKNIENNQWRFQYMDTLRFPENHPSHWMFQGNKQTLGNVPRDVMLQFFNSYYSANNMNVVVVSPLPMDQLKAMVQPILQQIPNKHVAAPQIPAVNPSDYVLKPSLIEINSATDAPQLNFVFPLPAESDDHWQYKNLSLFADLLSFTNHDSLQEQLKQRGWIQRLSAFYYTYGGISSDFSVRVQLTPLGEQNWTAVAKIILNTIEKMKTADFPSVLFENQKRASELNYLFSEAKGAEETAQFISRNYRPFFLNDIAEREQLYITGSPERYKKDVASLDLSQMSIYRFSQSVVGNQKTEFYKISYQATPLHELDWLKSTDTVQEYFIPQIHKNIFFPKELTLITEPEDSKRQILTVTPQYESYLFRSTKFNRPMTTVNLQWTATPAILSTDKDRILNELLTPYLQLSLTAWSAMPGDALYRHKWTHYSLGQQLSVNGFSENLPQYVTELLEKSITKPIEPALLKMIVENQLKSFDNLEKNGALEQAQWWFRRLTNMMMANPQSVRETLLQITAEDLNQFRAKLLQTGHLRVLFFGNIQKKASQDLSEKIQSFLKTPQFPQPPLKLSIAKFPMGSNFMTESRSGGNNAWISSYQFGNIYDNKKHALSRLLGTIISAPFYSYMRTEKQLGYIVNAQATPIYIYPSLQIVVQSQENPIKVGQIARDWIKEFGGKLKDMPKKDFENYKKSVVENLKLPAENFEDENDAAFTALSFGRSDDYKNVIANTIQKISHKELIQFYNDFILGAQKRELSVYIQSSQLTPSKSITVPSDHLQIPSIDEFKKSVQPL